MEQNKKETKKKPEKEKKAYQKPTLNKFKKIEVIAFCP